MTDSSANHEREPFQESRPPNAPWQRLSTSDAAGGYLSYYYSDDLSNVAVRAVTKLSDNKSDPNFETDTYGLFSTCSKSMRRSIVNNGIEWLIFFTRFRGKRHISGFYRIGYYADTKFEPNDYCLSAIDSHFVKDPLPLSNFIGSARFRLSLRIPLEKALEIVETLKSYPNVKDHFISEVHRLEKINDSLTGLRYVNFGRTTSFDWTEARLIFDKANSINSPVHRKNKSSTNRWICHECSGNIFSISLLKTCPYCKAYGSLYEATTHE